MRLSTFPPAVWTVWDMATFSGISDLLNMMITVYLLEPWTVWEKASVQSIVTTICEYFVGNVLRRLDGLGRGKKQLLNYKNHLDLI